MQENLQQNQSETTFLAWKELVYSEWYLKNVEYNGDPNPLGHEGRVSCPFYIRVQKNPHRNGGIWTVTSK